jgi:hypothetical protein
MGMSAAPDRPVGRALLAMVIAFGVRIVYLAVAPPYFTTEYWQLGESLREHFTLGFDGVAVTYYEPLYPAFLAAAQALASGDVRLVQAIQAFVDATGAGWLYLLTARLTGRTQVASLAGLLHAFNPVLVRHSVAPGEFSLLSTILIAAAYFATDARTLRRAAVAGACLGVAVLTRTMVLPIVPAVGLILSRGMHRRTGLVVIAVAAVAALPLAIRNYGLNGSLLPTRGGVNLFIGNGEYASALLPDHSPDILQSYARTVGQTHGAAVNVFGIHDSAAADRMFTRLTLQHVAARPLETLWLKLRNALYFFWPRLVPAYVHTERTYVVLGPGGEARVENSVPRPSVDHAVYTASWLVTMAAAAVGLWRRRRALESDLILLTTLAVFLAAGIVYFPATRYRAPVEFVLLFYAASGADWFLRRAGMART